MISPDEGQQAVTNPQVEQELKRVNDEWAEALAQRDGAALDRIMADDFMFAYPFDGDDKGQFITDVVRGEVSVKALETRDTIVRVYEGAGVIFGSETANWQYRGRDFSGPYKFFRVYARRQGRWQLVILHLCPTAHR